MNDDWFWSQIVRSGDCWIFRGLPPGRYGEVTLADGRRTGAHRVAARLAGHKVGPGDVVCHRCDNPPCVNPAHLFVGTQADNMADKAAKGRAAARSRNGAAKLTDEQFDEIERRVAAGERQNALAREFGVSPQAVCQYLKRRRGAILHSEGVGS